MSLRLDLLQAAQWTPTLPPEAGDRIVEYLRGRVNEDGGGKDRSGASDLYYTVFVLEGLQAMGVLPPVESVLPYLRRFDVGDDATGRLDDLDLVHLTCLARCWSSMPAGTLRTGTARRILERIESHRSADGGYSPGPGTEAGTAYHCYLALGAYQDLHEELPNPKGIECCLHGLRTGDGAFANERGLGSGTTPTTAAVVTLMRQLGLSVPREVGHWLLARCSDQGGFLATPEAPIPDLLSTATALHALATMGVSFEHASEPCLDFLDSLWTGRAFRGHWADDVEDSEYTFYALLALGHLSQVHGDGPRGDRARADCGC